MCEGKELTEDAPIILDQFKYPINEEHLFIHWYTSIPIYRPDAASLL